MQRRDRRTVGDSVDRVGLEPDVNGPVIGVPTVIYTMVGGVQAVA
jgi:hypothetical protein